MGKRDNELPALRREHTLRKMGIGIQEILPEYYFYPRSASGAPCRKDPAEEDETDYPQKGSARQVGRSRPEPADVQVGGGTVKSTCSDPFGIFIPA